jgi:hypothetical protein
LSWPERDDADDDDTSDRSARQGEELWSPASRAAACEEHAHIFRLLTCRPAPWVLLELPVSLLCWVTAAVPGKHMTAIPPPSRRRFPNFHFSSPSTTAFVALL